MHRTTRSLVIAMAAVIFASVAAAQTRVPGAPASSHFQLPTDVPTAVMPTPDVVRLKAEDEANQYRPFRYGAVLPTTLASDITGRWDTAPDGARVWRQRIESPGAFTIAVVFDIFELQAGARVFLYDDRRAEVLGAYTDHLNNAHHSLGVEPIGGDALTVEYVVPAGIAEPAVLQIGQVIHDYRNLRDPQLFEVSGGGYSGSCLVDINCPAGSNYQVVKRAAIRTLASGALCSGAILNNTAEDQTPYMLTANHCGNMVNGVFLFNFENTGCGTGDAVESQTLSGATLLAASATYDSQLYRLNQSIPLAFQPFFAGWDRTHATGAPAVSIGHGGGAPKQVAVDSSGASPAGTNWAVTWDTGTLIGGNSGGPLFNALKRVVGPACCVTSFTCGLQTAFYGRLRDFWTAAALAQWLAPGVAIAPDGIDGFDPLNQCGATASYGSGCPGGFGVTPKLAMSGCFAPNNNVTLDISLGLGGSTALVLFGINQAATPIGFGCTLNVSPLLPLVLGPLPLGGAFVGQGALSISTQIPAASGMGSFTMQAFVVDPNAPAGYSTTNGQSVTLGG